MSTTNTTGIAASPADEVIGVVHPIMAGDTPAVAARDVLFPAALGAIAQYTPLSFAAGAYKVWAAGETIVAMTAYAVPDKASDQRAAVFTAGCFNMDAVNWPGSTTDVHVEAATINSQLAFKKPLWSDKRVTVSGTAAGTAAPAAG